MFFSEAKIIILRPPQSYFVDFGELCGNIFVFGCNLESKSKRITLKQKHKIIRKVKEHHRKKAKEAKKLGLNHKRKVEKDPGIPNDWPFKEQELKALEARRARALEELEQKKAARKERVPFSLSSVVSIF